MTRPTVYLQREMFDGITKVVIYCGPSDNSKVMAILGPELGPMPNRRRTKITINGFTFNCKWL